MVYNVLGSVKEKVEAQQSAGVDAARRRLIDRPAGEACPDDEDKATARYLLKGKVRARKKTRPYYETAWFQAGGILALLGGVALTLYLVFRPPSADKLYADAERLMKSGNADKIDEARDGPIREYLTRYEARLSKDPKTKQVRQWADDIDARYCEAKLQKHLRHEGRSNSLPPARRHGEAGLQGGRRRGRGRGGSLREKWLRLQQDQSRGWQLTAQRHLRQLDGLAAKENEMLGLLKVIHLDGKERQPEGGEQARQAFLALRHEKFGDLDRAERGFKTLKKQNAEEPDRRFWFLFASRKLKSLVGKAPRPEELLEEQLKKARKLLEEGKTLDARKICIEIAALYASDKEEQEVKDLVAQARDLRKAIDEKISTT